MNQRKNKEKSGFKNVLLVDGAYLKYGFKEMKNRFDTDSKLLRFDKQAIASFFDQIALTLGHDFDRKYFFDACEGFTSWAIQSKEFEQLIKNGFKLDVREFKVKSSKCQQCDARINQKVQAEVDVAIATKLIDSSLQEGTETITLLAGDRDFYDSIQYALRRCKSVEIVAFRASLSHKLKQLKCKIVLLDPLFDPKIAPIAVAPPS
mmetsp:Transcript_11473/g.19408  ORF Transcript_11473/g.19408 Transcript_11473/m.19408 type:complete len:206 (+) Transcript_11473:340-957(+)